MQLDATVHTITGRDSAANLQIAKMMIMLLSGCDGIYKNREMMMVVMMIWMTMVITDGRALAVCDS